MADDIDWNDPSLLALASNPLPHQAAPSTSYQRQQQQQQPHNRPAAYVAAHPLNSTYTTSNNAAAPRPSANGSVPSYMSTNSPARVQYSASTSRPASSGQPLSTYKTNVNGSSSSYVSSTCQTNFKAAVGLSNISSAPPTAAFEVPDDAFNALAAAASVPAQHHPLQQSSYNNPFRQQQQHQHVPLASPNKPVNGSITSLLQPSAPTHSTPAPNTTSMPKKPVPLCRSHQLPMTQNSVKKQGPNTGRLFWSCSLSGDDKCKEFVWDSELKFSKLNMMQPAANGASPLQPHINVQLEVASLHHISVKHQPYNVPLLTLLKGPIGAQPNPADKKSLLIEIGRHAELVQQLNDWSKQNQIGLRINEVPKRILRLLQASERQHVAMLNDVDITADDYREEDDEDVTDDAKIAAASKPGSAKPTSFKPALRLDHSSDDEDNMSVYQLAERRKVKMEEAKRTHQQMQQQQQAIQAPQQKARKRRKRAGALKCNYSMEPPFDVSRIPADLWKSLMQFQREGVEYAVSKLGRAHISDEMGLGKSIQAIAMSAYYRDEWPVLVICPSSMRLAWSAEFLKWLPNYIASYDINVVLQGSTEISNEHFVTIVSYDLVSKLFDKLEACQFKIVIADESHYIKSAQAKRTQCVTPLIKQAKRALLLSGTPALNRPNELYTQINALIPTLLPTYTDFGVRYCDGHQGRFGWEMKGGTNLTELHLLLTKHVLIRREKASVLTQLPSKRRQAIVVDVPANKQTKRSSGDNIEKLLAMAIEGKEGEGRDKLFAMFQKSGEAKLKGVCDYIETLIESEIKFLVFAHHISVLNGIEEKVKAMTAKAKTTYMRIDGSTKPEQRQANVELFQADPECKIAILSTMAAGTGITLTAASNVVFAELAWSPMLLAQAEDRVHRIGQKNSCNIHYLLGKGTIDDDLWPMLSRKLAMINETVSGVKSDVSLMDMSKVERPEDGSQKQLQGFVKY